MHCSACSSAVEASLGELPGVLHSSISLILRKAIVRIDPSLVTHVSPSLLTGSAAGALDMPQNILLQCMRVAAMACLMPHAGACRRNWWTRSKTPASRRR